MTRAFTASRRTVTPRSSAGQVLQKPAKKLQGEARPLSPTDFRQVPGAGERHGSGPAAAAMAFRALFKQEDGDKMLE